MCLQAGGVRPWRMFHGTMHPAGHHLLRQAVPHVRHGVLHAFLLEDIQPSKTGVRVQLCMGSVSRTLSQNVQGANFFCLNPDLAL